MENSKSAFYLQTFVEQLTDSIANKVTDKIKNLDHKPETHTEPKTLLNTDELAKHLKVSKSHINKLRKKHKNFPVIKIDGAVRFKISEVETFFHNLNNK